MGCKIFRRGYLITKFDPNPSIFVDIDPAAEEPWEVVQQSANQFEAPNFAQQQNIPKRTPQQSSRVNSQPPKYENKQPTRHTHIDSLPLEETNGNNIVIIFE